MGLIAILVGGGGLAAVAVPAYQWYSDRRIERRKRHAFYVNPFLAAAEDLQSRLRYIIETKGIKELRQRHDSLPYVEETIYLIAQYFAWETVILRFGPYTQKRKILQRTEAIRNAFATDIGVEDLSTFCFFKPEQRAIGQLLIKRVKDVSPIEFTVMPLHEFKEQLCCPPLSDMQSVKIAIHALREAKSADTLRGRDRLIHVQHALVNLLNFIDKESWFGFRQWFDQSSDEFIYARQKAQIPSQQQASRG